MITSSKLIELGQILESARQHGCEKIVAETIKEIRKESDRLILSMGGETLKRRTARILRKHGRQKAVTFYWQNMRGNETLHDAVLIVNVLEEQMNKGE